MPFDAQMLPFALAYCALLSMLSVGLMLVKITWIPDFEFLRDFVKGGVLLIALFINGRIARGRD